MISKTVKCPKCKTHITIQGNPGETTVLICPNCNTKGKFTFQKEKVEIKTISGHNTIEVKNLTKSFNGFKALDNVSFNVKKGEILGFVGPNGPLHQDTLISIISMLIKILQKRFYQLVH